jgi:hypothetical protein
MSLTDLSPGFETVPFPAKLLAIMFVIKGNEIGRICSIHEMRNV